MTTNRLISLLLTCIAASICPSLANDSLVTASPQPLISEPESAARADASSGINLTVPSPAATAQITNPTGNTVSQATKSSLPKKVFSVATALVIGTPVCIVRRTKYEEGYGVNGLIGNSDNKCKKVLARVFWSPCAVISGTLEAPFDAFANGLMYPAFSKDQLSQGKLIQNN